MIRRFASLASLATFTALAVSSVTGCSAETSDDDASTEGATAAASGSLDVRIQGKTTIDCSNLRCFLGVSLRDAAGGGEFTKYLREGYSEMFSHFDCGLVDPATFRRGDKAVKPIGRAADLGTTAGCMISGRGTENESFYASFELWEEDLVANVGKNVLLVLYAPNREAVRFYLDVSLPASFETKTATLNQAGKVSSIAASTYGWTFERVEYTKDKGAFAIGAQKVGDGTARLVSSVHMGAHELNGQKHGEFDRASLPLVEGETKIPEWITETWAPEDLYFMEPAHLVHSLLAGALDNEYGTPTELTVQKPGVDAATEHVIVSGRPKVSAVPYAVRRASRETSSADGTYRLSDCKATGEEFSCQAFVKEM